MSNRYAFIGRGSGRWRVRSMHAVRGEALDAVGHLDIVAAEAPAPAAPTEWVLRGLISNVRYATRAEVTALQAKQEPLNRPAASRAALDSDQEIIRMVGTGAGRTQGSLRRPLAPYRDRFELPAGDRAPALSLPRPRRTVRFSNLVRVRTGARGGIRRVGRSAPHHGGMDLRRAGDRHPARAGVNARGGDGRSCRADDRVPHDPRSGLSFRTRSRILRPAFARV